MEEVKINWLYGLWILLSAFLLGMIYHQGITYMVGKWATDENYGHGFFVPLISFYLIWQQRHRLQQMNLEGSWWGLPVILAGLGLYFAGELATLYVLVHLSLWLVLIGLLLSSIGVRGVKEIAFPIFYLLAMIPLPDFLHQGISGRLQLISSQFGVGCLQLAGVMAYREGNVIDLGPIQLQVVEACSGLRYLFPLAALALICAYLFKDQMWKRVLLFLSSFPIAIFLNGFRIGITGILVDLYGVGPAEGFFHNFSGWILFVAALAILFTEMWILGRIGNGKHRRPFTEMMRLQHGKGETQPMAHTQSRIKAIGVTPSYLCAVGLLIPVMVISTQLVDREETPPQRQPFFDFPMRVGSWEGKISVMDKKYVDTLRFDDYLLADYRAPDSPPVNFYIAYYNSQKKGQSAHSPKTCIPGGGWEITSLQSMMIDEIDPIGEPLKVNRATIQKGDNKQVVLYWFQQRGRLLTNEYLVKFYLFWDALTKNRTDGALVRLTAVVAPGESESSVDNRLTSFARTVLPVLKKYIPD